MATPSEITDIIKAQIQKFEGRSESVDVGTVVEIGERMTQAAEAAAADVRAQARVEADRIREKGRVDARSLHDQALAQLRSEVASMVVLAASRLLGREINADQHRALIEQSISEAGAELKKASPN